jgi:hypothetical protein
LRLMSPGNDGRRGGYEGWLDEDEEKVSRSLVSMYEVRSVCTTSKSMGSSNNFRDSRLHTHQLEESGMGYSTCTVRVSERAKPPKVGKREREGGRGDQVVMAADVLLTLLLSYSYSLTLLLLFLVLTLIL